MSPCTRLGEKVRPRIARVKTSNSSWKCPG